MAKRLTSMKANVCISCFLGCALMFGVIELLLWRLG